MVTYQMLPVSECLSPGIDAFMTDKFPFTIYVVENFRRWVASAGSLGHDEPTK